MVANGEFRRQPRHIMNLLEGLGGLLAVYPGQHNIQGSGSGITEIVNGFPGAEEGIDR
ncbi:hypothetical protein D3C75_1097730 [compost metagenome]